MKKMILSVWLSALCVTASMAENVERPLLSTYAEIARKLFIKACRGYNLKGCYYMGIMYKRGANGVTRNIKKAKKYFAHACKKGYEAGCVQYRLIKDDRFG